MIIKYKSCDGCIVEEKVDKVEFFTIANSADIELICYRSKDNPYYDADDGFKGCFYVNAEDVEVIYSENDA
jgi:hypothetical protein